MKSTVALPSGITGHVELNVVTIKGPKGTVTKELNFPRVILAMENNAITISAPRDRKEEKRIINTYIAHINNMIYGVTNGYECKLKLVYVHFPPTVKLDGNKVKIENFLGERAPRIAKIAKGAKVDINKQDIKVTGVDLEAVDQTAANMETATRIRNRDRRIFQDGIFITEKPE